MPQSTPADSPAAFWTLAQASDPASPLMMGGNASAPTTGTSTTQGPPAPAGQQQQAPGLGPIIWLLPVLLLFFILMTGSTQRREKKRMAQLMSNLKKQDKVLTIGGIIGTVAEIRDDEIVLKVDENSNTRMRFTRNAIQQVLKQSDLAAVTPGNSADPKIEVKAGKGERAAV
jgi:preprotein translocase subunit YajC